MSQDVGFQQQGSVDWTAVANGTVSFTIDVLSRLSNAGVEAFTLCAARAIFSNIRLGANGELRLHQALEKLRSFPSVGKVLWFGFGVRHIIWSMRESAEGLACIAICASLTESYTKTVSAKIMRELFLLYSPPAELTPALRQWMCLIETSEGLLASTEFGLVLHGLSKLCLGDDLLDWRSSGSPKDIALWPIGCLTFESRFETKMGRLSIVQMGREANLLQIRKLSLLVRKHYTISSGLKLFSSYIEPERMMSYGRVPWETCLVDTFGNPMKFLLRTEPRWTGRCLGLAARLFLAAMRDGEGIMSLREWTDFREKFPPASQSSYGRGFYLLALRLLPELNQDPALNDAMERALDDSYSEAAVSLSSLLLKSWMPGGILTSAQILFTGQEFDFSKQDTNSHKPVAVSHNGLCFCLNTLNEITSDPQRACVVTIIPGRIEWNGFTFDSISDVDEGVRDVQTTGYNSISMTNITQYDNLTDSSSSELKAELLVEETAAEARSLHVTYRITTPSFPGHYFSIGAAEIWCHLNRAFTAFNCERTCESLNGFPSLLVEGDGLIHLAPTYWEESFLPIIRVLPSTNLSIWVALSQRYLLTTTDSETESIMSATDSETENIIEVEHRLQENIVFDARGDTKLCVGETDPVTFTVCSRALARTSPVFDRMLFGPFMESKTEDGEDWVVKLPEDKPAALSLFLRISHGQFDHVPRIISIDDLYDLSVTTNYYDCTHMLEPWTGRWMASVEDNAKTSKESMAKGLWIAWEFGRKDCFCRIARRMLMESDGSEDPDLPMQPDIIQRISATRLMTIQALLDAIRKLVDNLLVVDEKPGWCRHAEWMGPHRCESMILGSITFCLSRAGLWPLPEAKDVMDSIIGLHRKMKGLVVHDIGKEDGNDHTHCNPREFLLTEVERVLNDIRNPVTKIDLEEMDKQLKRLMKA
ncbi:hypothetical protein F53441_13209 [Fusarium austroafricanum]|uniref:BTB domain-containing protein n=1 Tax=Fusarium austroafricanum TaxID=2364996 RepID=A0A8H4JQW9_9HYPO|nr:hypothetical protein F53441_13209 [Fusarium austroafricanum]